MALGTKDDGVPGMRARGQDGKWRDCVSDAEKARAAHYREMQSLLEELQARREVLEKELAEVNVQAEAVEVELEANSRFQPAKLSGVEGDPRPHQSQRDERPVSVLVFSDGLARVDSALAFKAGGSTGVYRGSDRSTPDRSDTACHPRPNSIWGNQ